MRDKVWATLNDMKYKGYLLGLLVERFQKLDRRINIFLALASSSSIAAWAVWKQHPFLWSSIIATSQILTAIKPYFPYFKYVKELNHKCHKVEVLNIELERLWYKMQTKKIGDDQAESEYYDLRKAMSEALVFNDDTLFSVTKDMEKKATQSMRVFLKNHYNTTI